MVSKRIILSIFLLVHPITAQDIDKNTAQKKRKIGIIIASSIGVLALAILTPFGFYLRKNKKEFDLLEAQEEAERKRKQEARAAQYRQEFVRFQERFATNQQNIAELEARRSGQ